MNSIVFFFLVSQNGTPIPANGSRVGLVWVWGGNADNWLVWAPKSIFGLFFSEKKAEFYPFSREFFFVHTLHIHILHFNFKSVKSNDLIHAVPPHKTHFPHMKFQRNLYLFDDPSCQQFNTVGCVSIYYIVAFIYILTLYSDSFQHDIAMTLVPDWVSRRKKRKKRTK